MTVKTARLKPIQITMLENLAKRGGADLRKISEAYRQMLITFGMMDPPLVQVDADRVTITEAGHRVLDSAHAAALSPKAGERT